jgi:hypothetical protein
MTEVRRIVTGHDAKGRSIIARDGAPPTVDPFGSGARWFELWRTEQVPARIDRASAEPAQGDLHLHPPQGGVRVRMVEFLPETGPPRTDLDPAAVRANFARINAAEASTYEESGRKHPAMHRTESLDYGIVLEGEITLILDEGETLCRQGDVVVQNGTSHAWANRSGKLARMAFVLIDGKFADGLG